MKHYIPLIFLCLLPFASCIENDIPYPVSVPTIAELEIKGAKSLDINASTRTVSLVLDESSDLSSVCIDKAVCDPANTVSSPDLVGTFDLTSPLPFTLTTYQDYDWKLEAVQHIERYFNFTGQVGKCVIDDVNHRVVAHVSSKVSLSSISVAEYKLGPEGRTEYSTDLLNMHDFTEPVEVDVTFDGRTEHWRIIIEQTESAVSFSALDAWTRVAWMYASAPEGAVNGFRYRKAGDEGWKELSGESIITDGGSFSACADGLEPQTEYECCAFSGDDSSETRTFTTEAEAQLPNSGFEVYSNAESKNFLSWYDPADAALSSKWWDSGNVGSTMVGASGVICAPDTDCHAEGGASARLNSRYVVIKFAAGNLFSGEFAGLVGTSGGIVNFGRPFTLRPRKLTLMLKYDCGKIDNIGGVPSGTTVKEGDPDRCQVFVALGDWNPRKYGGSANCPVQVNTTKPETLFNPSSEAVIAYGAFTSDKTIAEWTRVEIPLDYVSTSRVPTHIIVSCAASMLGDYFTGSSSSVLWVDDVRLEY
ncbi:MAG: PCMD domain-containing protein [Bacteroidales bacterium]|nr:PCMD domain-containing protein [Bacteroidales bacterium]